MPGGHYDFASGDSDRHTPNTGVVALLLAKDRALTAASTSKLLRDTSVRGETGADGAVHVDACAAMVKLRLGRGSCTTDHPTRVGVEYETSS